MPRPSIIGRMKRYITLLVALISVLLLATVLSGCDSARIDPAEGCIRVHIRANSDSDLDQSVKLEVRDALTQYLTSVLANCKDKNSAYATLQGEKENLKNIADKVLYAHNMTYKASVALTNEHFPERVYDKYTFPEGDYDALIVNLGSGKGQNWWCVAFPPLCFVPAAGEEKIVYKSWVKEMLDKIFG